MKHCIFRGQRPAQPPESESAPFGRSKERAETRARRIASYPDFPTYSSPTRKERGVPMVAGLLAFVAARRTLQVFGSTKHFALTPAAPLHQKSFCEIFLVMTEDVTIFDYAHSTLLSSACSAAKCNLASSFLLFDKNLSKKSFCRFHKDTMQGTNCGHLAYTKCYASYACFSRAVDSALRSRFLTAMSKTAVRNAHTAHRADVHNASLTLFTKNLWQRNAVS